MGSSASSPSWLTTGASGSGGAALSGGSGSGASAGGRRHEQDLINAYEAEEERIINLLSRKLEQVCALLV